jgi:hypothetical protein
MKRTYEIHSRPDHLGGGWNLKLLEDGQEAGGGAFPAPRDDPHDGMAWWNALTEERRALAHDGGFGHARRGAPCLPAGQSLQRCFRGR